ncbi:hypothetical protein DUNSADRAFT_6032 [Dunaliella salina]|uniref:Uncharacterized protein n=1 Tax=Dunaliella salina TaxID=3046 RepID=A0ABQ7GP03_DUNSA|nr:hypothetical protein DUNSADRAFT_6032 [Dunaliella salina]|eukprot:KAF5836345.1 hypothetical protein DUNSADRAFT_6032 [Dunaliella salina]
MQGLCSALAASGGCGSSHLSSFLNRHGFSTNLQVDSDNLRHCYKPPSWPKDRCPLSVIYLYCDPLKAVASHYRRGHAWHQSLKTCGKPRLREQLVQSAISEQEQRQQQQQQQRPPPPPRGDFQLSFHRFLKKDPEDPKVKEERSKQQKQQHDATIQQQRKDKEKRAEEEAKRKCGPGSVWANAHLALRKLFVHGLYGSDSLWIAEGWMLMAFPPSLEAYCELGIDLFGLQDHFHNWRAGADYEILMVRYEHIFDAPVARAMFWRICAPKNLTTAQVEELAAQWISSKKDRLSKVPDACCKSSMYSKLQEEMDQTPPFVVLPKLGS